LAARSSGRLGSVHLPAGAAMFRFSLPRCCVVLFVPCVGGAQAVARVTVTPAAPSVVAGQTLKLRAEALDASGRPVPNAVIKFQQTAAQFEGVVDDTGFVSAGAVSTIPVTVTAVVPGQKPVITKVNVNVLPGPAASLVLEPKSAKLLTGQRFLLKANVYSAAGDRRSDAVKWSSSSDVVTIGNDGTITAAKPGTATVTAQDGSVKSSVQVQIVAADVGSLTISPASSHARTGDVVRFTLSVKNAAGQPITGLTPTWTFGPGQGQVDPDGAFVGYDAGTYTVSASVGPRSAQTSVTLTPRDVRRPATIVGTLVRNAFPTSEVWVHPNGKVAYLGTHL